MDDIFEIVWPEKKTVSADRIKIWFADALDNGDIASEFESETDPAGMAAALDEAGIITLRNP